MSKLDIHVGEDFPLAEGRHSGGHRAKHHRHGHRPSHRHQSRRHGYGLWRLLLLLLFARRRRGVRQVP